MVKINGEDSYDQLFQMRRNHISFLLQIIMVPGIFEQSQKWKVLIINKNDRVLYIRFEIQSVNSF